MTMETRLIALAQAIGADIKALTTKQGDLTSLATTAKDNLVAAINEIYGLLGSIGAIIDDGAGDGDTSVTWSADKIHDSIEAATTALRNSLVNGAGAALDTFKELQDAIGNDPSFAATLATQMSKRVRVDAAQTFTTAEKLQGCNNLGIGDPEHDFLGDYATAKA